MIRADSPFVPRPGAQAFYRLPYGVRRSLFRILRPGKYATAQRMRAHDGEYSFRPFDELRCIFVHIPKTGGVSVSRALFGNLAGGHATIRHYQMVFNAAEFEGYFKFAFVRNPWDRLLSAYEFLRRGGMNARDAAWAREHLSAYRSFDDFVRRWLDRDSVYRYDHFVPQLEFIRLPGQHRDAVDFIGRFEHLERDFAQVCDRLGRAVSLGYQNRGPGPHRPDYRAMYTPAARRRVEDVYRDDIEALGYDF